MEILILMVPMTVILVGIAILAFNWAVDHGQYEDVDKGANDALFGEPDLPDRQDEPQSTTQTKQEEKKETDDDKA